jgi:hypothetical protein
MAFDAGSASEIVEAIASEASGSSVFADDGGGVKLKRHYLRCLTPSTWLVNCSVKMLITLREWVLILTLIDIPD